MIRRTSLLIVLVASSRDSHAAEAAPRPLAAIRMAADLVFRDFNKRQNAAPQKSRHPATDYRYRLEGKLVISNCAFGLEHKRELPETIQMVGPLLPSEIEPLPPWESRCSRISRIWLCGSRMPAWGSRQTRPGSPWSNCATRFGRSCTNRSFDCVYRRYTRVFAMQVASRKRST